MPQPRKEGFYAGNGVTPQRGYTVSVSYPIRQMFSLVYRFFCFILMKGYRSITGDLFAQIIFNFDGIMS